MTKHLEELEEISRLRLGIILLIKELDKNKDLKSIVDYLKDLIEGVDENTTQQNGKYIKKFFKDLETKGEDE